MKATIVCRNCGIFLDQFERHWCWDCWRAFLKGAAAALGTAIAGVMIKRWL